MRARGVAGSTSRMASVRSTEVYAKPVLTWRSSEAALRLEAIETARHGRILRTVEYMTVRRARGAILRIARHRRMAIAIGVVLTAPALWFEFSGGSSAWWLDGLGLIAG